jgi:hypothetical protein
VSGYGLTIKDCVFSDITGSVFRNQSAGGTNISIENTDITRVSGTGVRFENTDASPQANCTFKKVTFEYIVGNAVEFNKGASGGYSWNTYFDTCYFEGNTGYDVDISPNGSSTTSFAHIESCAFVSTPSVNLGSLGQLLATNTQASGGNQITVTGSGSAFAQMLNCQNLIQSGTFGWSELGGTNSIYPAAFTPTVTNVATSAVTGSYTRHGRTVTVKVSLTVSAAPTGNITISLPIAANAVSPGRTVGLASGVVAGSYFLGACWLATTSTLQIHNHGTGTEWDATHPGAWANGNSVDLTVEYFV